MTHKVAQFLADHQPATPCLVLDVDRVEENFRALSATLPLAITRSYAADGTGAPADVDPCRAHAAAEIVTAQADTRLCSRVMERVLMRGGRWPNCEQRAWRATFPIDGAAEPRGWPNGKFPPCRTPSRPTSGTACCR